MCRLRRAALGFVEGLCATPNELQEGGDDDELRARDSVEASSRWRAADIDPGAREAKFPKGAARPGTRPANQHCNDRSRFLLRSQAKISTEVPSQGLG